LGPALCTSNGRIKTGSVDYRLQQKRKKIDIAAKELQQQKRGGEEETEKNETTKI
jgi:hypothetical protein